MNKNQEDREFGNLRKLPMGGSIVIFGRLTLTETPRIHSTFVLIVIPSGPPTGSILRSSKTAFNFAG
jgi:hypothetical protein